MQLHMNRFTPLAAQGAAWIEFSVGLTTAQTPVLLHAVARTRYGVPVALSNSTLLDAVLEDDPTEMTGDAADLFSLVQTSAPGVYAFVLSNAYTVKIGTVTGDDDHPGTVDDAGWPDFAEAMALSAAAVARKAAAWSTLSPWARTGTLSNPEATSDVLRRIAAVCTSAEARLIVRHPGSTAEVLQVLLDRHTPDLDAVVVAHPAVTSEQLRRIVATQDADSPLGWMVLNAVAVHPAATAQVLTGLMEQYPGLCDAMVALHANTPPEVLRTLAESGNEQVRRRVAANSVAPVSVLRALTTDPDEQTRLLAAGTLRELSPFLHHDASS